MLICLFFLTTSIYSQENSQEKQYLDKYLVIAAENNPELKSLYNQYQAALEQVTRDGALPDPQLNLGYFIQPVETRLGAQRGSASFSQMFPWFGTLDAQEKVAVEQAKSKFEAFEDAKLELFRDVKTTYNELYYLNEAIRITKENLGLLASFKGLAEVQFESGRSGFSSVLQVEMEEEELQTRLAYLEDSRQPLETQFEQLLNISLEEPVFLPEVLWKEQLLLGKQEIFQNILKENPRLDQLEYEAKSFKEQVEVARKQGFPSINLGASYTNISPRNDIDPQVGLEDNGRDAFIFPQVGIRLPLYRKKYKAMRQQALLQQEAAIFRKKNLENQLLTEMEEFYRNYLDAQRKVLLYDRLTNIARQSLELLQTELSTGQNNVFEIIRMERQLLGYNLELVRAQTEQNNSIYRINYLMGQQYETNR